MQLASRIVSWVRSLSPLLKRKKELTTPIKSSVAFHEFLLKTGIADWFVGVILDVPLPATDAGLQVRLLQLRGSTLRSRQRGSVRTEDGLSGDAERKEKRDEGKGRTNRPKCAPWTQRTCTQHPPTHNHLTTTDKTINVVNYVFLCFEYMILWTLLICWKFTTVQT